MIGLPLNRLFILLCLLLPFNVQAYSYSAAGKEPFLDSWIAISNAANEQQWQKVGEQLDELEDELINLESEADLPLVWKLRDAQANKSLAQVGRVFSDIFIAVVEQRLNGAQQQINSYQSAKVHVAKSKRFVDLLLNDPDLLASALSGSKKQQIQQQLDQAMKALGKPGMFGAAGQPADPDAFIDARQQLLILLRAAH